MSELQKILHRFPSFDASYETVLHKNLPTDENYTVGISIPFGKKYYIWYTYYEDADACFIMELNREKQIVRITPSIIYPEFQKLALGTILYVSCVETATNILYFIEDIYYYEGLPISTLYYGEKLGYIEKLLQVTRSQSGKHPLIFLPNFFTIDNNNSKKPNYPVHHIQFRSLTKKLPFLNQQKPDSSKKSESIKVGISPKIVLSNFRPCIKKPQYRMRTVFLVRADIAFDIYHLYAYCGKNKNDKYVYYDVAYIPNYPCSSFMNRLFRNIRENKNSDYIEESDDEDDFYNPSEDKYVDLKKQYTMECEFHPIFKKWVPLRIIQKPIVSVDKL